MCLLLVTTRYKSCEHNVQCEAAPRFFFFLPPFFFFLPASICVQVCVKCRWKIVTFNKGSYPETIFPDTQWPFKPDWGEGVWGLDFEPASSRCVPLFAGLLFIVWPGSAGYAKQAELPASTFANQFVCARVKDAVAGTDCGALCHRRLWHSWRGHPTPHPKTWCASVFISYLSSLFYCFVCMFWFFFKTYFLPLQSWRGCHCGVCVGGKVGSSSWTSSRNTGMALGDLSNFPSCLERINPSP